MAYKFAISKILFRNGTEIAPKKVNVFIGPNSAGKSQSLKDIRNIMAGQDNQMRPTKIIEGIDYNFPRSAAEFIDSYIPRTEIYTNPNESQAYTKTYSGLSGENYGRDSLIRSLVEDQNSKIYLGDKNGWMNELDGLINDDGHQNRKSEFLSRYGRLFMIYTGTKEKLLVVERSTRCGSNESETNLLSDYNLDDGRLGDLYDDVKTLFHKEIILDRTAVQYGKELVFRVGDLGSNLAKINGRELQNYQLLEEDGDGIKDYVAAYLTLMTQNKNVILIDEPETFLHRPLIPPLAKMITRSVGTKDKQVFLSTHSSDLVKALVEMVGADKINIIRLTRNTPAGEVSVVNGDALKKLTEDHVLSSANAIGGLFAKHVYITEAEADRIIYSRLHDLSKTVFMDDVLFMSATSGKYIMPKLAKLYERLGVEYTILTDFDFICPEKTSLIRQFMKDGDIDKVKLDNFIKLGHELRDTIGDASKKSGFSAVPKEKQPMVKELIKMLKQNHVNVLLTGELETCLIECGLPYSVDKNSWLTDAINKIYELYETGFDFSSLKVYKNLFE